MSSRQSASATARAIAGGGRDDAVLGREWAEALADVPLFRGLSKRHLRRIAGAAGQARFAAGTEIVRRGSRGETFYLLLDGEASVERDGGERVELRPGSFFGEMALLDGGPRSATVTARTPVHVMRLSRRRLQGILVDEPAVAVAMLRELAQRLRERDGDAG